MAGLERGTLDFPVQDDNRFHELSIVRIMKSQRSDTRKDKLIKDGKKMKIDDIVLKIESINNNL